MTDRHHSVEKEVRGAKDYTENIGQKEESRRKNLEFAGGLEKGLCPVAEGKGPSTGEQEQGRDLDDPITNIDRERNLVVCQGGERGPGSGRERSFDCRAVGRARKGR